MIARLRFLTDEDFDNDLRRGLRRRLPELDVVRAQDVGLAGASDPMILEFAAVEERILLTHDVSTMPVHAYDRVAQGLPMPGVFVISQSTPLAQAIEELLTVAECSLEGEWEGQVVHLPL
jgi:hypothetical protein